MDQITEIKRKNGVAAIKLASGETLRVPSPVYLERRLHANQVIDPDAYRVFVAQRSYPHALEAAMKFLALRERSEQEVRARLGLHDLVSDSRFAETWVHARSRKYGKSRIAQELRMKGVSSQEAQAALEGLPEEEEYQRALDQAKRLCRKFQSDPKKIAQSLMRKGYSWSMARRAAEEAAAEKQ